MIIWLVFMVMNYLILEKCYFIHLRIFISFFIFLIVLVFKDIIVFFYLLIIIYFSFRLIIF